MIYIYKWIVLCRPSVYPFPGLHSTNLCVNYSPVIWRWWFRVEACGLEIPGKQILQRGTSLHSRKRIIKQHLIMCERNVIPRQTGKGIGRNLSEITETCPRIIRRRVNCIIALLSEISFTGWQTSCGRKIYTYARNSSAYFRKAS